MQLGTENRKKTVAAGVLLGLALILVVRWIFTSPGSPTQASTIAPAASAPHPGAGQAGGRKSLGAPRSLDPTLRYDWLKATEDTKYTGSGRNIFRAQVDIPKPIQAPVAKLPPGPPPGPPLPPPPPPINLVFFGFANKPGEPKKVFLSQDGDVFIAKEGDIVDRRYKILRITPVSVEVEDVLNNNRQSIPLKQG